MIQNIVHISYFYLLLCFFGCSKTDQLYLVNGTIQEIKLDYKFYISNQIMKPVKQLLDIAIDPDETTKLFNSYLQ